MTFTTADIQELRKKTSAGMMDCKNALEEANGNMEQAVIVLRKKGLAGIVERGDKAASEGTVGHYIHAGGKIGVLVEVNCETDFVAKGDAFKQFAKDLAMHIAASNPTWITRNEVPEDVINREKSIIEPTLVGKPPQIAEKMMAGKLSKVFKEVCLMEQPFVKDPNMTISDLLGDLAAKIGEKIVIKRFVRFVTGE
jgi:elongation factor Ts